MGFDADTIENVWSKGMTVDGYDKDLIRKDCCGAWIMREAYGNREDDFGWEIDHVYPKSRGGDDNLDNLRPMQWQNNDSKQDDYPTYNASIKASGVSNVVDECLYTVNNSLQEKLESLYSIK